MDGISSANAILGTAVIVGNGAIKLGKLYIDWKDVPEEARRAKREIENAHETLKLINIANLTALGKEIAEKLTCLVPRYVATIVDCTERLKKLTPQSESKIPATERSKFLFNKRKWNDILKQLKESTSALTECMLCCMQIYGNILNARTAGKVDALDDRVERLILGQDIILQHIISSGDCMTGRESEVFQSRLPPPARTAFIRPANAPPEDEVVSYGHESGLDADVSLFNPQSRRYRSLSLNWLQLRMCETGTRTRWELHGKVPLPTFLQANLSASIAFQTRVNQWCIGNIKISCLGIIRNIDCGSFIWQACLRGDEAKVHHLINEEFMDPRCTLDKGIDGEKHSGRLSDCCKMFTNGDTLLSAAVVSGNRRLVRYLLQEDLDPGQRNDEQRSAVFLAFRLGYTDIARDLANRGAPLDDPDKHGLTVLDLLIEYTPASMDGPSDKRDQHKSTPAENRASELLTFLIGREFAHFGGVLMDGQIDKPILRAAKKGLQLLYSKLSQVLLLLTAQGQACIDPLEIFENASRRPCISIMREVMLKYPDLDVTYGGFDGEPILITIINKWERVSWKTFETVLQRGVDVNARSSSGRTAMHHAAMRDSPVQVLERLIDYGADVNARCKLGKTPLHQAASECYAPAVRFLVKHGADVNCQSRFGHTPLHGAASMVLPELGSLSWAKECEAVETLSLLFEAGADPLVRACGPFREYKPAFCGAPVRSSFAVKTLPGVGEVWFSPGDLAWNQEGDSVASRIYRRVLSHYMDSVGRANEISFEEGGAIFWDALEVL